jgi:antibiotic biosynthesis monooxygenase (ABM) superfamily enzyme
MEVNDRPLLHVFGWEEVQQAHKQPKQMSQYRATMLLQLSVYYTQLLSNLLTIQVAHPCLKSLSLEVQ